MAMCVTPSRPSPGSVPARIAPPEGVAVGRLAPPEGVAVGRFAPPEGAAADPRKRPLAIAMETPDEERGRAGGAA